ncbi:MAG: hypothetical protein IJ464_05995 [Alistipes sp.]|nr:hypothetical protein [Alistipes sp.]
MLHITPYSYANAPTSITLLNNIEKFEQYYANDYDKALHYARLVDADLDTTNLNATNAAIYDLLAQNYEEHEFSYTEALRYRRRSCTIYQGLGDKANHARTLADIGRLYFRLGDYHNAFTFSHQAQEMADTTNNRVTLRETYLTMELVDYFYNKDTASAMRYNRLVSENYTNRDEARQTMRALNNRFHYPLTPNQVDEILSRSEALNATYDYDDLLINTYLNVALQQILFGDLEECAEFLALAKPMIKTYKDEGYYYSALGFYHINIGDIKSAIDDTRRSIEILSKGDFDEKNVHSYFLLQELYHLDGKYKEAYLALMQFAEIYTRQNNTESAIKLSKLINELELKHAEEGYRQQRLHLEQQQEYDALLWRIHAYALVVLTIFCILVISRHRLQRKNQRLKSAKNEQEINHKNEIIRLQKMQQYQEQHNISKLTDELILIANTPDNKVLRSELKQIIQRLQKGTNGNSDWVEVEQMMIDSNDTFFENLIREYPNLTKNERKLCTFIHLNLSTKEISNITHQSIGSINIARSRLRRKFGITGDDKSLIAFLDRFKGPTTE